MDGGDIAADLARTAARTRRLLAPEAVARVAAFTQTCRTQEGAFRGRGPASDLYYTLFGLAVLRALRCGVLSRDLAAYLDRQPLGDLDLVHLASLVQCRRLLHPLGVSRRFRDDAMTALARFLTPDGGFSEVSGHTRSTAYGTYLGVLAYEILGCRLPDPGATAVAACRHLMPAPGGAPLSGSLNALCSAALVAHALCGRLALDRIAAAIHGFRDFEGGYRAHASAPCPDLLSTAVAAFALKRFGVPLRGPDAVATASFVQGLWHENGGFLGWLDDRTADCEYTFYALLALGALEP
ncbi:MAG: hypothetical protein JXR77_10930 [Lentisphaeria bacterium]|nr:hypothetical protein [Lentisphaeria bacterium]